MAIAVLERDRIWARALWRPHCAASLTGIRVAPFTAQNMSNNSCVTKDEKECRLSIFMMGEKPARVSGLPCQENRASLADRVRHRKGREALTIERRYSFPAGSTMSSSRWDKRSLNPERVPRPEVHGRGIFSPTYSNHCRGRHISKGFLRDLHTVGETHWHRG